MKWRIHFPGKVGSGGSLKIRQLRATRHECKPASWRNQPHRGLDRMRHPIDGAQRDAGELGGKQLRAFGIDFCGNSKNTNGFLKEGCLLAL